LIGIGSPVFRNEPINVSNFIKDMWGLGGKHVLFSALMGQSQTSTSIA